MQITDRPKQIRLLIQLELIINLKRMRASPTLNFRFSSLRDEYMKTIKAKLMHLDPKQLQIIDHLQKLNDKLVSTHPAWKPYAHQLAKQKSISPEAAKVNSQNSAKKGFFSSLFSKDFSTQQTLEVPHGVHVKGTYLYGGSGSGKSFMCDLFYDGLPIQQKNKMHFHEFMASIHSQLFQLERSGKTYDPLVEVAKNRASKTRLLFLDEFQVTDVADASILRRLFQKLIQNQMVLLATSNRSPSDLYKNGHQRQFFLPFISLINEQCNVLHLDSKKDYRYDLQQDTNELTASYLSPIDEFTDAKLNRIASLLSGVDINQFSQTEIQPIPGRKLVVPKAAGKVCFYEFNELVDAIMGDSDFRAICKHFKAIIIREMRVIGRNERNIANRLIKLFDQAYFRGVKIIISGTVGLADIIVPPSQKQAATEEDFAMIRCKSRLIQFQTKKYKEGLSYVQKSDAGITEEAPKQK